MRRQMSWSYFALLSAISLGATSVCHAKPSRTNDLVPLYDRIAADLRDGLPLVATVFVALCDNDTQGIVKVRNRRICRGDDADHNLYWASAGGLAATMKAARWRQVTLARFSDGPLAARAVWRKSFLPGDALLARGVRSRFDVYVVGLGYRGARIREAMVDYLNAVNRDDLALEDGAGVALRSGGASHLVAYIGHDYFYDTRDWRPLLDLAKGDSVLPKATLALSCTGDRLIRPAIRRANARILLLNRTLGFPGAWAAEAAIAGLAQGQPMRAIHRAASEAFAAGMGMPVGTALRAFAYGD